MKNNKQSFWLVTKNKKAYFDYEIINTWEAWVKLLWHEVKSIRYWNVNLKWSYIVNINNELYIKGFHISARKSLSNKSMIETEKERKIFLHKKDIIFLSWKSKEAWYSIIPLELYFSWSLIKLRVWLAKWKKSYEKKQHLKEKAMDKQAKIAMKKYI